MSYFITTDATIDLPLSYFDKDFHIIPMSFVLNNTEYGIDKFLSCKEFYAEVRNGSKPTTSLITTYFTCENLRPILEAGNDILHIAFSSGLSGTYENAVIAVDTLRAEFPERTILLIDSKGASTGEGMQVYLAMQARDKGLDIHENYKYLSDLVDNICYYFTADDLFHLQRGGRISKAAAIAGTLLQIKPLMYCNINGKLIAIDKVKGRKKALLWLVDMLCEKALKDRDDQVVFISNADCVEDAEFVKNKITKKTGRTNVHITDIGPVIGTHCGPGTVALFFIGDNKISPKDETLKNL